MENEGRDLEWSLDEKTPVANSTDLLARRTSMEERGGRQVQ